MSRMRPLSTSLPGLVVMAALTGVSVSQPQPAGADSRVRFWDGEGRALALQAEEDLVEFLRTAPVGQSSRIESGINRSRRVILEKGALSLTAVFRDVHSEASSAPLPSGRARMLRDDSIFELAAYRLSRLIGIGRVPPTVEREVDGVMGTLQLWIHGAMTDEDRALGKAGRPELKEMGDEWQMMALFDNLIFNDDRNHQNVLYDRQHRLWMIDHTRAFRSYHELPYPSAVERCESTVWKRLKAVRPARLRRDLEDILRPGEIDALIVRRKLLVEHIQELIEDNGKSAVLF